jgi:hypothetical protein
MNKRINRLTSFIFAALLSLPLATLNAAEVTDLRCEYLKAPLGIDVEKPRLSWKLETGNLKPETGSWKKPSMLSPSSKCSKSMTRSRRPSSMGS